MHYDEDYESELEPRTDDKSAARSRPASEPEPLDRSKEEFVRFLRHAEHLEGTAEGPKSLREWLDLAEAWRIIRALRECKGNRSAAARSLGIGRRTLYAKMDKLGITATWSF